MTQEEIDFMLEDLKQQEQASGGSPGWMWFGLTEKLMLSNPLNRKQVERLTFIECSELLLLWNRREEEMNKQKKKEAELANSNKNMLKRF